MFQCCVYIEGQIARKKCSRYTKNTKNSEIYKNNSKSTRAIRPSVYAVCGSPFYYIYV